MPPEENVESTLIWYKKTSNVSVHYWVNELNMFLNESE